MSSNRILKVLAVTLFAQVTAAPLLSLAHAATPALYGVDAMTRLDRLPYLTPDISTALQSSVDLSGDNGDVGRFLYSLGNESVILDLKGPGVVYNIWTTGFTYATDRIKIYFDGETQPRIDMVMADFFAGLAPAFPEPLSVNEFISSGGFACYVPLPFARSIRIAIVGGVSYYHIGYHRYAADAQITSWTTGQDLSAAKALWRQVGADPKPAVVSTPTTTTGDIGAGQTKTLLDTDGPRQIQSLRIKIPELGDIGAGGTVKDGGRCFSGYSQFTMKIDPANQGVRLKRRFSTGFANQKARVSVDGTDVGVWFDSTTPGLPEQWKNSSIEFPPNLTAGKSAITIRVTFISSSRDAWMEFYYWVYSKGAGGAESLTDWLDVQKTTSETVHAYSINNELASWTELTFDYAIMPSTVTDVLNNLSLKVYYDNELVPSIDAPLGPFFCIGYFGPQYTVRSLMLGVEDSNYLYCYFPMPFARHCKVELASKRSVLTANTVAKISLSSFAGSFDNIGYFKTRFNHEIGIANDRTDLVFVDTSGAGKLVGVNQSLRGAANRNYMEGDERILVDNNRSPVWYGTGTEDFYNGGWTFRQGPFSLQMDGAPFLASDLTTEARTVMYRLLLHDAIGFRSHIRASIEHGPNKASMRDVESWSMAYFYHKPQPSVLLTDSLDIGNTSSETAHAFTADSQVWSGSLTSAFEGEFEDVQITHTGRSNNGTTTFNFAIAPSNGGVIIRRMFDQYVQPQQADATVDGVAIGTWYKAGLNGPMHRWREDEFLIPATNTNGKSRISISLRHTPGTPPWTQFKYWAFCLTDTLGGSTPVERTRPRGLIMDLAQNTGILSVYKLDGRIVRHVALGSTLNQVAALKGLNTLLPSGTYTYRIERGAARVAPSTGFITIR